MSACGGWVSVVAGGWEASKEKRNDTKRDEKFGLCPSTSRVFKSSWTRFLLVWTQHGPAGAVAGFSDSLGLGSGPHIGECQY